MGSSPWSYLLLTVTTHMHTAQEALLHLPGPPAAKIPWAVSDPLSRKPPRAPKVFSWAAHVHIMQSSDSVTHLGKHWRHCLPQAVPPLPSWARSSFTTAIVLFWNVLKVHKTRKKSIMTFLLPKFRLMQLSAFCVRCSSLSHRYCFHDLTGIF